MSRIRAFGSALLLLAAAVLGGCGESAQEEPVYDGDLLAPEQANYETVQAESGAYIKTVGGSMRMYYPVTAELRWEEDNARFREILVRKGQEVKQGDSLATFDIDVSRADREALALSLARAIEDAELGKRERLTAIEEAKKKLQELNGRELNIARLRVGKAETEYEQFVYQSEREIARLRESLEEIDQEIADDTLFAPFDGVIDTIATYNPGDPATKDIVVVSMHSTESFYLVADDASGRLRYNAEVTVEAGKRNDRKTYEGRVVAAPSILPSSVPQGMALVELYGDIPVEALEGNLQYQFNVEELQDVLLVDWRAVDSENGKSYVYVLEDDMVQKRYVAPGLNNREKVWILDGLHEGQTVIAD